MEPARVPAQSLAARPWAHVVDFGPPRNAASTRGLEDCGTLPVLVDQVPDRDLPICRSYWTPTADELAALNAGEPVQLAVWGVQVPVDVQVGY